MDTINIVDALKGQCEQLRRLLSEGIQISEAPKATAEEIATQVAQLKSLIAELEDLISQYRK